MRAHYLNHLVEYTAQKYYLLELIWMSLEQLD
jgi:hypothetical protein